MPKQAKSVEATAMPSDPRTKVDAALVSDGLPQSRAKLSHKVRPIGDDATPSMAQYLEIKAANPDSLLWYRMGDFYELFFEDAVVASEALSIVLTKRGKHQGEDIAMCGVPVHRADEYLQRLIRKGYRVAVCEQLEDPAEARKRGAKAVVRRDVVRLVTPGTLTEDALLDARQSNYLTSVFFAPAASRKVSNKTSSKTKAEAPSVLANDVVALASIDISTGACEIGETTFADLPGELARLQSGEVLVSDEALSSAPIRTVFTAAGLATTPVPSAYFDSATGSRDLKARLGISDLTAHGDFSRFELAAVGAVLTYIELTQMGQKPLLRPPTRSGQGAVLTIDAASRASLELVKSISGNAISTLLAAIDRTVTSAGSRELKLRLASPLSETAPINARLDAVSYFVEHKPLLDDVRHALRHAPDLARALPRLAFERGGPRDLAAIRDALSAAADSARLLDKAATRDDLVARIAICRDHLAAANGPLLTELTAALEDDPPTLRRDGGFIRANYNSDLDASRALRQDSRAVMAALETRYQVETGIKTLKIRHNNILGFFIEVTPLNAKALLGEPWSETFRHRQTMANAVRFTTVELIDTEGRIASANERATNLEQEIFADLVKRIHGDDAMLSAAAASLAELDVYCGLAIVSLDQAYVRPTIDDSVIFDVRDGRHPVVQQALAREQAAAFIANDCSLAAPPDSNTEIDRHRDAHDASTNDGKDASNGDIAMPRTARLWLVTGPNMAGKSTFLRQNALIVVLAQMGSFVPATYAHIGVVDRLFSRVGASDDLARGRSTFMVEMVETAAILTQSSERSMVILDEIGRGTSTFDGLSIAWATVEYLHAITRCRALFATHYHELTALAAKLDHAANVTMDVSEWRDDIVFLHKVRNGAADRSYGIQVAKLAGLPQAVVRRARDVLMRLEAADRNRDDSRAVIDDLPLFSTAAKPTAPAADVAAPLLTALAETRPDELSPKAALERLYELKALAESLKTADRS